MALVCLPTGPSVNMELCYGMWTCHSKLMMIIFRKYITEVGEAEDMLFLKLRHCTPYVRWNGASHQQYFLVCHKNQETCQTIWNRFKKKKKCLFYFSYGSSNTSGVPRLITGSDELLVWSRFKMMPGNHHIWIPFTDQTMLNADFWVL